MSTGAAIGLFVMLGALLFGLWALLKALIGPARKLALNQAGYSVLLFLAGAVAVGTGVPSRPTPKATAAVNVAVSQPAVATDERETAQPVKTVAKDGPKAAPAVVEANATTAPVEVAKVEQADVTPAISTPKVEARYQTSHTLVSLVLKDFSPAATEAVKAIAQGECGGSDFCSIGFWTDDEKAPRTLKMSDDAVAARLAHYVHSKATGLDTLKWNCNVVPAQSSDCL